MKQNKIIKTFFITLSLLTCSNTEAQLIKLYATKDDYVNNRYEIPASTVSIQDLVNPKRKSAQSVLYQFYSTDNTLRYQIGRNTFLVEYNDSLYMNIHMLKNKKKQRFGNGFAKIEDQDGLIFFESYPQKSFSVEMGFNYLMFGIVGGEIIRKVKLSTTPTIYHHYDPETDTIEPINKQLLTELLKHDQELLSIFNKEPDQEHIQILSLYAKAFFTRKTLKEKEAKTSKKEIPDK